MLTYVMTEPISKMAEPDDFPAKPVAEDSPMSLGRVVQFGSIVSTILLLANALVCATWSAFFGLPGWLAWQAVPGLLAVTFVVTSIAGFRVSHPLVRAIHALSASWLGVLNFAFFAAVACWIVAGIAGLAGLPWLRVWIGSFFFGLAFLTAAYGLINASWLRTTRVTISLRGLAESWQGRTIALVTDLHLGQIARQVFVRRITARLRALKPDAVLISGDMFDGSPVELDRLAAPWSEFSAPRGIYYVTGNHDEFADRRLYINAVKRTGIRVLNNEKISVDGLQIIGVHDSEAGDVGELRAILRGVGIDPQRPSILLSHQPSNLSVAEEAGVSLQLSGHTHGGQLWPWNGLVSRLYGRFAYGLSRLGNLQVFTSNGASTWGPPLRVGTKSEVVLIRLEAAR